jgi:tetratricopeptide (TPR) repeat protein
MRLQVASLFKWMIVVWMLFPHLAAAQDRTQLMSDAALEQDWLKVSALAEGQQGLSPVERLLVGHAELAMNRNNDSLVDFLMAVDPEQLAQWLSWTIKLRANNPESAIACYLEGDALARLHQWPAAIDAFSAGLQLAPSNALLLNARGVSFAAMWVPDRALDDLTKATVANPRLADTFLNIGSYWVQQKRDAYGAKVALDKALAITPDSVVALMLRSNLFLVQGNSIKAQADINEAVKHAGLLMPAVQIRLEDTVELLQQPKPEGVEIASASSDDPGMQIRRSLESIDKTSGNTTSQNLWYGASIGRMNVNQVSKILQSSADFTAYGAAFAVTLERTGDLDKSTAAGSSAVKIANSIIASGTSRQSLVYQQFANTVGQNAQAGMVDKYMNYMSASVRSGEKPQTLTGWLGGGNDARGRQIALDSGMPSSRIDQYNNLVVTPRPVTNSGNSFISNSSMNMIGQGVGSAVAGRSISTPVAMSPSTKPSNPDGNPGGFKTNNIHLPRWQGGEWPFTPWYGLGYAVTQPPEQKEGNDSP